MTDYFALLPHYIGLLAIIPIAFLIFVDKNYKKAIVLFGIYLVIAAVNVSSFLPFISSGSVGVSVSGTFIYSPALNGYGLLILILYCVLNFDTLVDIRLDRKEAKGKL